MIFKEYVNVPMIFGWINKGVIFSLDENKLTEKNFLELIRKDEQIVMKPNQGAGGKGVFIVKNVSNKILVNERSIEIKQFMDFVKQLNDYIITEFITQHEYSNNIYRFSSNTIRIITILNNENEGEVEIPVALHRFWTSKSQPVDNVSFGGIFSKIDIKME